jgi:hypothetical protein
LTFCQWHFPFELSQLVVNRERLIGMIRVGEMGRAYFEQDHFIKKILRALVSRATVSKGDHNGVQYARSADAVTKRAVADGAARFAFRHHDSRPRQRNRGGHQRSDCSWIATRFNEIEATQRVASNATSIGAGSTKISCRTWYKVSEAGGQFSLECPLSKCFQNPSSARPTQPNTNIEQVIAAADAKAAIDFNSRMDRSLIVELYSRICSH